MERVEGFPEHDKTTSILLEIVRFVTGLVGALFPFLKTLQHRVRRASVPLTPTWYPIDREFR